MEAALCVYTTVTQDRHTKWKKWNIIKKNENGVRK